MKEQSFNNIIEDNISIVAVAIFLLLLAALLKRTPENKVRADTLEEVGFEGLTEKEKEAVSFAL